MAITIKPESRLRPLEPGELSSKLMTGPEISKDRWISIALAIASFVAIFVLGPWFVIPFLAFTGYAAKTPSKEIEDPTPRIPSPVPSTEASSRRTSDS